MRCEIPIKCQAKNLDLNSYVHVSTSQGVLLQLVMILYEQIGVGGLESLKYSRHYCQLKWYCNIMHLEDERFSFKLLLNEWDKVDRYRKGCP